MAKRWNYCGDINLECGGFFWQESGYADYVYAVSVTPCSEAGGPDNKFLIEVGSIFISEDDKRINSALDCIGMMREDATRADIVYAVNAYAGLDGPNQYVVQIGKDDENEYNNGWNPDTDYVLRGNTKLKNYVKREFLS